MSAGAPGRRGARAAARTVVIAFARERRWLLVVAAACTLAMIAAMVRLPAWAGTLVREVIPNGDASELARHLGRGVAIVLVLTAATFARDYTLVRLAAELAARIRERMVRRALRRPLDELDSEAAGTILSRASNDVAALQHALVRGLAVFAPNAAVTLALLAAMLVTSWRLTLGVAMLVLPMLALVRAFGRRLQVVVRGSQERLADVVALLRDCLDGARELRAFGREAMLESRFVALGEATLRLALREERMAALHPAAVTFVGISGLAGLVFLATWMHRAGAVPLESLIRFLVLVGLLVGPLQESVRASGAVARVGALLDRCAEMLATPVEEEGETLPPLPPRASSGCAVRLEDVRMAHVDGAFTLGPLQLTVETGEVVAIVGPSGAGKSTLLDLVARLREPTGGRILLDGRDVALHRRDSVRARIALVTQEPFLFPGTVSDNIRLGRAEASDEEVRAAARSAHAEEFIARLPGGHAATVERRGANLSVGQRQRIALARALLRDPALLLLDEPTSALDAESERLLVQSLREVCRGRTTLIVTHRPALLALADRVVALRDGRIESERPAPALAGALA